MVCLNNHFCLTNQIYICWRASTLHQDIKFVTGGLENIYPRINCKDNTNWLQSALTLLELRNEICFYVVSKRTNYLAKLNQMA